MNYVNEQNMQEILDGIARKIGQGGGSGAGLEDWKPSNAYKENDIFVYSGQIYKSIVDFESDTTFSVIQILEEYALQGGETPIAYTKGTDIVINDIVSYDSNYYKALYDFTCGDTFGLYAVEQYTPKELTEVQEAEIINHFLPNIYSGGNMSIEDSTPIGTIISFMGTIVPENYLVCDGTIYNIADYIELAEFIKTQFGSYDYFGGDGITTFAVPDLQGEFLRMTGTNSHTNQGSGASVGVHQDGTKFVNTVLGSVFGLYVNTVDSSSDNRPLLELADSELRDSRYGILKTGTASITQASTDNELLYNTSRPTNTSVLYCIKYKMSITNAEEIKDLTTEDIKQIVNSYNPVFEEAKGVEYSTEERRIGTWIDGKPLYQKTYSGTTPSVANTMSNIIVDSEISTMSTVFISEGYIVKPDATYGDDCYMLNDDNDTNYMSRIFISNYGMSIRGKVGSELTSCSLVVTIKYTKKTD